MSFIDLTGRIVGKLTVVRRVANVGSQPAWVCLCACGTEKRMLGHHLRAGKTPDCGCGATERRRLSAMRHGCTDTPEWKTWIGLFQRCGNPNSKSWKRYGGRGITICDRWKSFENFLADMGPRPEGTTLDRINNDGNYEPGNCRWADPYTQYNNRRSNVTVTLDGDTKTLVQWARHFGVPYPIVKDRRSKGVEGAALFAPSERRGYGTRYECAGKALTITEWARELGSPYITIWQRIHVAGKNPDGSAKSTPSVDS